MSNTSPAAPAQSSQRTPHHDGAALASLKLLYQPKAFVQRNRHVFPSLASWRWFYRQHRTELIQAGAVVELAGRLLVDEGKFSEKAIAIGTRAAMARTQR